jgi:hypothetical protein
MAEEERKGLWGRAAQVLARLSPRTKAILLPAAAAIIVGSLTYLVTQASSFKVSFDTAGQISVEMSKKDQPAGELLEKMFQSDMARPYLLQWLKSKSIYSVDDTAMVDALAGLLPEIDEQNPIERQRRYSDELEKHKSIAILRERAAQYQPPFQHVGRKVKIGVPENEENRPPSYKVNVPFDSPWVGKRIKIYNPYNSNKFLTLEGKAAFAKTDNVDMQLNYDQAIYLFTSIVAVTVEGVAYVLPYSEDPYDPTHHQARAVAPAQTP